MNNPDHFLSFLAPLSLAKKSNTKSHNVMLHIAQYESIRIVFLNWLGIKAMSTPCSHDIS